MKCKNVDVSDKKKNMLAQIGRLCAIQRFIAGYTTEQVAQENGYTKQNISAFEKGRNSNLYMLTWYVKHGLPMDKLERIMKDG